jgi:hypothetical protein
MNLSGRWPDNCVRSAGTIALGTESTETDSRAQGGVHLSVNIPELVRSADKVCFRSLLWVWGKEYRRTEPCSKGIDPPGKVQALQRMEICIVQPHTALFIQVDQPRIKGAVIGGGQCNSVPYMVRASRSSHRENVGRVHQFQLNPGNGALIPVGKQNPPTKISGPAQSANLANNPLALF